MTLPSWKLLAGIDVVADLVAGEEQANRHRRFVHF